MNKNKIVFTFATSEVNFIGQIYIKITDLFTGKLSAFFAIYKANLWILIHLNYIIKRRRKIKTNHIISEDLMAPYSIVKQYFKNRKTTYNQLN